jgi:uncharacterized protein (TIGR02646 family)
MKFIVKGPEPQEFTDWKALENEHWQPTYKDLSGQPKRAVEEALRKEQGNLCCYCERGLRDGDFHIEHFQPQSDEAVDPLDFSNLLCSCQNQLKKGEPRHCGNLKDDWYSPELLISPLDFGCEQRFSFTGDGEIQPASADDVAATETIKRLGLNIPKLQDFRTKAIEPFLDEGLSAEELGVFVAGYLKRDEAGQFQEFWTTIHYLFATLALYRGKTWQR